jgi:hypothetical protein
VGTPRAAVLYTPPRALLSAGPGLLQMPGCAACALLARGAACWLLMTLRYFWDAATHLFGKVSSFGPGWLF